MAADAEKRRLKEARDGKVAWKKWGPYLSERQWGTVREDYSQDGNAWESFSHDQARSRVYRWGEEGLAGIFLRDRDGRPVYRGATKFQTDPHWRYLILSYEYFHGDNGAGMGASYQTG